MSQEVFDTKTIDVSDPNLAAQAKLKIRVVGVTPLIMADPQVAMQRMLDIQKGVPLGKRPPKNPEQDMLDGLICIGKRPTTIEEAESGDILYGSMAIWWKCLAVRCGGLDGHKMTQLRTSLFVPGTHGDKIPLLDHSSPVLRADRVCNANGNADVRIRPMFEEWAVEFDMVFNSRFLTPEQITAFFIHGGQCCGVGEWRPERNGSFGTFKVVSAVAHMPKLQVAVASPEKVVKPRKATKKEAVLTPA